MKRRIVLALLALVLGCGDDGDDSPRATTTSTNAPATTTTFTTTTFTAATITTTSTFGDTTSTTIPGGDVCQCNVTFSVTNTETLGALQYDTTYAGIDGGFDGAGGAVDCTRLSGDFAAFNDIEAERRLSSAFISAGGFTGPADIARCAYTGYPYPSPPDFSVTITDQSRPDFSPANATVEVTDVSCPCSGSTTTTGAAYGQ